MNHITPGRSGRSLTYVVLLTVFAVLVNRGAHAMDPARIGFVDMPKIMQATGIAGKSDDEVRRVASEARTRLESEQQDIMNLQQEYKREEAILSESQRTARQQAIQSRLQAYQEMAADLQQDLNRKKLDFARAALQPVQKVIGDIAREEGLNAVFDRSESALVFVDSTMDLTDRVIERVRAGDN